MWYYFIYQGDYGVVVCGPYDKQTERDKDAQEQGEDVILLTVDPSDAEMTVE